MVSRHHNILLYFCSSKCHSNELSSPVVLEMEIVCRICREPRPWRVKEISWGPPVESNILPCRGITANQLASCNWAANQMTPYTWTTPISLVVPWSRQQTRNLPWFILLNLVHTENLQFLAIFHKLAANERIGFCPKLVKYQSFFLILLDFPVIFLNYSYFWLRTVTVIS